MVSRGAIHSEKKGLRESITSLQFTQPNVRSECPATSQRLERLNGREWVLQPPRGGETGRWSPQKSARPPPPCHGLGTFRAWLFRPRAASEVNARGTLRR